MYANELSPFHRKQAEYGQRLFGSALCSRVALGSNVELGVNLNSAYLVYGPLGAAIHQDCGNVSVEKLSTSGDGCSNGDRTR